MKIKLVLQTNQIDELNRALNKYKEFNHITIGTHYTECMLDDHAVQKGQYKISFRSESGHDHKTGEFTETAKTIMEITLYPPKNN